MMIIIVMIMTRAARLVIMFIIGLVGCQDVYSRRTWQLTAMKLEIWLITEWNLFSDLTSYLGWVIYVACNIIKLAFHIEMNCYGDTMFINITIFYSVENYKIYLLKYTCKKGSSFRRDVGTNFSAQRINLNNI